MVKSFKNRKKRGLRDLSMFREREILTAEYQGEESLPSVPYQHVEKIQRRIWQPYWLPDSKPSQPSFWIEDEYPEILDNAQIFYIDHRNLPAYNNRLFDIIIKNQSYATFVDSGAFKSLFPSKIADLHFPNMRRHKMHISGIAQRTQSRDMLMDIPFTFNGQEFTADFIIEEDIEKIFKAEVVLGINAFNKILNNFYGVTFEGLFNIQQINNIRQQRQKQWLDNKVLHITPERVEYKIDLGGIITQYSSFPVFLDDYALYQLYHIFKKERSIPRPLINFLKQFRFISFDKRALGDIFNFEPALARQLLILSNEIINVTQLLLDRTTREFDIFKHSDFGCFKHINLRFTDRFLNSVFILDSSTPQHIFLNTNKLVVLTIPDFFGRINRLDLYSQLKNRLPSKQIVAFDFRSIIHNNQQLEYKSERIRKTDSPTKSIFPISKTASDVEKRFIDTFMGYNSGSSGFMLPIGAISGDITGEGGVKDISFYRGMSEATSNILKTLLDVNPSKNDEILKPIFESIKKITVDNSIHNKIARDMIAKDYEEAFWDRPFMMVGLYWLRIVGDMFETLGKEKEEERSQTREEISKFGEQLLNDYSFLFMSITDRLYYATNNKILKSGAPASILAQYANKNIRRDVSKIIESLLPAFLESEQTSPINIPLVGKTFKHGHNSDVFTEEITSIFAISKYYSSQKGDLKDSLVNEIYRLIDIIGQDSNIVNNSGHIKDRPDLIDLVIETTDRVLRPPFQGGIFFQYDPNISQLAMAIIYYVLNNDSTFKYSGLVPHLIGIIGVKKSTFTSFLQRSLLPALDPSHFQNQLTELTPIVNSAKTLFQGLVTQFNIPNQDVLNQANLIFENLISSHPIFYMNKNIKPEHLAGGIFAYIHDELEVKRPAYQEIQDFFFPSSRSNHDRLTISALAESMGVCYGAAFEDKVKIKIEVILDSLDLNEINRIIFEERNQELFDSFFENYYSRSYTFQYGRDPNPAVVASTIVYISARIDDRLDNITAANVGLSVGIRHTRTISNFYKKYFQDTFIEDRFLFPTSARDIISKYAYEHLRRNRKKETISSQILSFFKNKNNNLKIPDSDWRRLTSRIGNVGYMNYLSKYVEDIVSVVDFFHRENLRNKGGLLNTLNVAIELMSSDITLGYPLSSLRINISMILDLIKSSYPDMTLERREIDSPTRRFYSLEDLKVAARDNGLRKSGVAGELLGVQDPSDPSKYIPNTYTIASDRYFFKCSCGSIWKTTGLSVLQGHWCPECSGWFSERACREFFRRIFKGDFHTESFEWLRSPLTNHMMHLDGFNRNLMIAFEYNGAQHYFYNKYFHRGDYSKFVGQTVRDKAKQKLCRENHVILIVVPYTIEFDRMQDFILEKYEELTDRKVEGLPKFDYKTFFSD